MSLPRARADLERAKANLARARDAMPAAPEYDEQRGKLWGLGIGLATSALKAAEHAVASCERLVRLAEAGAPDLFEAIADAERAAVFASNTVVHAMTLARLEPEWLTE